MGSVTLIPAPTKQTSKRRDQAGQSGADARWDQIAPFGVVGRRPSRCWRLVDQYGFAVFAALCDQHKPSVRHNEQGALTFGVVKCVGKFQAFLGI